MVAITVARQQQQQQQHQPPKQLFRISLGRIGHTTKGLTPRSQYMCTRISLHVVYVRAYEVRPEQISRVPERKHSLNIIAQYFYRFQRSD